MYRILAQNQAVRERRNQRAARTYHKPVLKATGPNQIWSWDITRLRGVEQGEYYYLYVMIDIFSRYVVGWMISHHENSEQAQHFISSTLSNNPEVDKTKLIIHSDRGSPMTAKSTVEFFAKLGLTQSFSRPRISDDNPFSEAQFKTTKYHRLFKDEYVSLEDAEETLDIFFDWYNNEHRHSGIAFLTPQMVHAGFTESIRKQRMETLRKAYDRNPGRFPNGTSLPDLPEYVGINLSKADKKATHYDG